MSNLATTDPITARTMPRSPEAFYRSTMGDIIAAVSPKEKSFTDQLTKAMGEQKPAEPAQSPSIPAQGSDTVPEQPAPVQPESAPIQSEPAQQTASIQDRMLIQTGDTLSEIALQIRRATQSTLSINTLVERIAQDNGIPNPDLIYPGMALDLRGAIQDAQSQSTVPAAPAQQTNTESATADENMPVEYSAQEAATAEPVRISGAPTPQILYASAETTEAVTSNQDALASNGQYMQLPIDVRRQLARGPRPN